MNLKEFSNIYFVGIGGIGMSAIARYFLNLQKNIAGYDKVSSSVTKDLLRLGAEVFFDDSEKFIPSMFKDSEKTLVVYTPAVPKDNGVFSYFNDNGFTVVKRAEVLGLITSDSYCLAVAGTHGKTTTSSILGHIMDSVNATSFLGGITENYNSNLILGDSKVTVVEADEFDRSFLCLSPNVACVTSMDADHLDIYGDHDSLIKSFKDFSNKVSDKLIVAKGLPMDGLTYAVEEQADYQVYNVRVNDGYYYFDVNMPSGKILDVCFSLPGRHNLMNALAAIAMADVYGVSSEVIKSRLETFKGVKRRFVYRLKTSDKILIDDYAHHPTEIKSVHNAIKEMYPNEQVLAIFQPHLFSRTNDFADDFAKELSKFDQVILLPIYPARELPMEGVNSEMILNKMTLKNVRVIEKVGLEESLKDNNYKIVVMLGAGDIGVLVSQVEKILKIE